MATLTKMDVWNELAAALERWNVLNDRIAHNEAVDPKEHAALGAKIQALGNMLDRFTAKEVA